jgi:Ni,Fe-hydrogenase maturation factor
MIVDVINPDNANGEVAIAPKKAPPPKRINTYRDDYELEFEGIRKSIKV